MIGKFPIQISQVVRLGLGIQPRYEAPIDLRVEIVKNAVINIGLVKLSAQIRPISRGTAKEQLKKEFLLINPNS